MMTRQSQLHKLIILSLMIALDVVLSPLFRIEGMAPMSSTINVIGAVLMGPFYTTIMALVCGAIRILFLGIPPLALTGALFGSFLAGIFYSLGKNKWWAILGEIIGTGLIGSLVSYPIMVWFTGAEQDLYWFIYTPRFFGGAISGSIIAFFCLLKMQNMSPFLRIHNIFGGKIYDKKINSF